MVNYPVYLQTCKIGLIAFNNSGRWPIFRGANSLSLLVHSASRCGTVSDYNEAMLVFQIICV